MAYFRAHRAEHCRGYPGALLRYHREFEEVGVGLDRVSPMLLPDDTPEGVKRRRWTATYEGTLR